MKVEVACLSSRDVSTALPPKVIEGRRRSFKTIGHRMPLLVQAAVDVLDDRGQFAIRLPYDCHGLPAVGREMVAETVGGVEVRQWTGLRSIKNRR